MKREIIDASKLELEDKVVAIKRVTKVVKGGRNSRVAALVVVGDRNGHVGVGVGKAVETPEAIRKGKEDAAKHLVTVPVNEVGSIPYDWEWTVRQCFSSPEDSSRRYWYHRWWSCS